MSVPTVAVVDGVSIMFFYADHAPPHFHVRFADHEALVAIDGLTLLEGDLPKRKLQSVRAWAAKRHEALMAAWYLAVNNRNPGKIA